MPRETFRVKYLYRTVLSKLDSKVYVLSFYLMHKIMDKVSYELDAYPAKI